MKKLLLIITALITIITLTSCQYLKDNNMIKKLAESFDSPTTTEPTPTSSVTTSTSTYTYNQVFGAEGDLFQIIVFCDFNKNLGEDRNKIVFKDTGEIVPEKFDRYMYYGDLKDTTYSTIVKERFKITFPSTIKCSACWETDYKVYEDRQGDDRIEKIYYFFLKFEKA